jgi:SAM-dependent methyltransferase
MGDAAMTDANQNLYDSSFFATIGAGVNRSARICAPLIFDLLRPRSALDVGCGQGDWLKALMDAGVGDVLGVDGDYVRREELRIPAECFRAHDLTRPLDSGRRFDVALCLEVAEHLPAESAEPLIRTLTAAAPAVVFSAAVPGQGGLHHINEQWPWYWQELFQNQGYRCLDLFRKTLWQNPDIEAYYQQNLLLFVDPGVHGALIDAHPHALDNRLTLVQTHIIKGPYRPKPLHRRVIDRLRRYFA